MLHTWLLECFSLHWWHLSRSDWRPTFNTRVQTTQRWWLFLLLLCISLSSTLKVDVNIDYGVEWPSVTSGAWMTSSCMPRMSETSTRWSFSIRKYVRKIAPWDELLQESPRQLKTDGDEGQDNDHGQLSIRMRCTIDRQRKWLASRNPTSV